jgi:hypothetical protein
MADRDEQPPKPIEGQMDVWECIDEVERQKQAHRERPLTVREIVQAKLKGQR